MTPEQRHADNRRKKDKTRRQRQRLRMQNAELRRRVGELEAEAVNALETVAPRLYRLRVVERATGKELAYGLAIFARDDIEAADAARQEYPSDKYRWFDKETGQEVVL